MVNFNPDISSSGDSGNSISVDPWAAGASVREFADAAGQFVQDFASGAGLGGSSSNLDPWIWGSGVAGLALMGLIKNGFVKTIGALTLAGALVLGNAPDWKYTLEGALNGRPQGVTDILVTFPEGPLRDFAAKSHAYVDYLQGISGLSIVQQDLQNFASALNSKNLHSVYNAAMPMLSSARDGLRAGQISIMQDNEGQLIAAWVRGNVANMANASDEQVRAELAKPETQSRIEREYISTQPNAADLRDFMVLHSRIGERLAVVEASIEDLERSFSAALLAMPRPAPPHVP